MSRIHFISITVARVMTAALLALMMYAIPAWAVPEVSGFRITDVTPASFSVVWMTDVNGMPSVQVFADQAKSVELTAGLAITPMPVNINSVADAARGKGIMKVRVSGLRAGQSYYVRAVMRDPENLASMGYSGLKEVVTASRTVPYRTDAGGAEGFSNDLSEFQVFVRPDDADALNGLGDLVIIDVEGGQYPVSAFVGDALAGPAAVVDLNNLYGDDGMSLDVLGSERFEITVYRGGILSTLTHFRRSPVDGTLVVVAEPVKGFFADLNLDGAVDDVDFGMFRDQYRTIPEDGNYNPDFDFVADETGVVDVREFSKFSQQYGRTGVE